MVFSLRTHAELELHIGSVERVLEYLGIAQEAPAIQPGYRPSEDRCAVCLLRRSDKAVVVAALFPLSGHRPNPRPITRQQLAFTGRSDGGRTGGPLP